MSPSVLLVEDHTVMASMLARFLRERGGIDVWASVGTAEAALERLAAHKGGANWPELALVDVSLPGMNGLDLVVKLGHLYPDLPVVMVSAHHDPTYVRQALEKGARGYVAKGDPPAIVEAVGQVLAGEIFLSDAVRRALGSA